MKTKMPTKTQTNPIDKSNRMTRLALALAFGATLGACEDIPPPKPRTTVSSTAPAPQATPTPPPAPVTPPPVVTPEIKTPDSVVKVEEPKPAPKSTLEGARQALAAGELDEALELANRATLETPKRSSAWNTLGRAQLRAGKRKAAIESFEKAVELNPQNSYAQNNLGLALIYDKQYEEAVDVLQEAVQLEPVEGYMWNNLGMAYEQLDRLEEARDAYGKAVAMQSDRARDSLDRLKGVESVVIRTAKVVPGKELVPGTTDDGTTIVKEPTTVTQ